MTNDLFSLAGKTALVTGSSRGIGRAILTTLADHGAVVIGHARDHCMEMEGTLEAVRARGHRAYAVFADLSESGAAESLSAQVAGLDLEPDVLVLNASIQIQKEWDQIMAQDFDVQMHVNCYASLAMIQQFAPAMIRKGWGRIVTIGSAQQVKPHKQMLVYAASKCSQLNMTVALAGMLAEKGVTVNNVAPGAIYTDRNVEAFKNPAYENIVKARNPVGFIGQPEDCAGAMLMLCSDAGRYITGENLFVDGGRHL